MGTKNKLVLLLSLGLLVLSVQNAMAVPKDVEAKAEFMLATDLYNKKDFAGAVEHTLAAKRLLGKTNPRIQSMLARSYSEIGKIGLSSEAVEEYFKLASKSDNDYPEIMALYAKTKAELNQIEEAQRQTASYLSKIEMVTVPGGCFQMGEPPTSNPNYKTAAMPRHEVCVDNFAMGKFEVTQGLWQAVMGWNNSENKSNFDHPVENVSWDDVQNFLKIINIMTGKNFRLPTEAEWEYACRSGGKNEKYCGGDNPKTLGWLDGVNEPGSWCGNSSRITHPVGKKEPNGLGIYDMTGNVSEMTKDWYDPNYYAVSPKQNPTGPTAPLPSVTGSKLYATRGATAQTSFPHHYASWVRENRGTDWKTSMNGFRLVLPQGQQ